MNYQEILGRRFTTLQVDHKRLTYFNYCTCLYNLLAMFLLRNTIINEEHDQEGNVFQIKFNFINLSVLTRYGS